jgi:hypothetical protein
MYVFYTRIYYIITIHVKKPKLSFFHPFQRLLNTQKGLHTQNAHKLPCHINFNISSKIRSFSF